MKEKLDDESSCCSTYCERKLKLFLYRIINDTTMGHSEERLAQYNKALNEVT